MLLWIFGEPQPSSMHVEKETDINEVAVLFYYNYQIELYFRNYSCFKDCYMLNLQSWSDLDMADRGLEESLRNIYELAKPIKKLQKKHDAATTICFN